MIKDKRSQKFTLFRYSLTAPAVTNTFGAPSLAHYFRDIATKKHKGSDRKKQVPQICFLKEAT